MTIHTDRGGYYARTPDGRRTRLFIDSAAATRAAERGETFSDAEYEAETRVGPPGRKRAGRWICTKGY